MSDENPNIITPRRFQPWATYVLIGLNVLVFIAMIMSGVSPKWPSGVDLDRWGAETRDRVLSGEYWRLLSCTFVHIGVIHIVVNMYSLYNVGAFLEQMIGRWRFILFYLSTGIAASMASVWWDGNHISAGASGAIFGVLGVLIAVFAADIFEKQYRNQMLRSLLLSAALTLGVGLTSGIMNNAAHLGGLFSGMLAGGSLVLAYRRRQAKNIYTATAIAACVLALAIGTWMMLHPRGGFVRMTQNDTKQLNDQFNAWDMKVHEALAWTDTTQDQRKYIQQVALPTIDSMKSQLQSFREEQGDNPRIDSLLRYCDYRRHEMMHLDDLLKGDTTMKAAIEQDEQNIGRLLNQLNDER